LAAAAALAACSSPGVGPQAIVDRGADTSGWWTELPRGSWAAFPRVKQAQPWFEVYDVAPGVFAIYEPSQWEEVISYLVVGDERALLFDSGIGVGSMAALIAELTELPVTLVNSHSHYDHVGGNHEFDGVRAWVNDYSRPRAAGAPHEDVAEFVSPAWVREPLPPGSRRDDYRIRGWRYAGTLADGEVIALGNRALRVLHTPGHSPDSICLLDEANGLLFTGDTFYPAPLYAHLPGSDFDAYRATAARLAPLAGRVSRLFPGHNETGLTARYLADMHAAFESIVAGAVDGVETDGAREFDFGDFSIIVPGDRLQQPD
jgi:glyoxylase-like metal-dependent hydrolase (beta-lactamase superfamily II)